MPYNIEFCGMGLLPIVLHTDADVARAFCYKRGVGRMRLQEELKKGNFKVKTVLCGRIAKVPSHDRLPHDDCEQREKQCSQDDAEKDACSKSACISDESGGCGEVVIADVLAGVVVRMDEFAPSVSSLESACNSSSHLFVKNVTLR